MILVSRERRFAAILLATMSFVLTGCGYEDNRLTGDKRSCLAMGHAPGSAVFDLCMRDLNIRRCGEVSRKGGTSHQGTRDCTRL